MTPIKISIDGDGAVTLDWSNGSAIENHARAIALQLRNLDEAVKINVQRMSDGDRAAMKDLEALVRRMFIA
jgi:hypothetical protein